MASLHRCHDADVLDAVQRPIQPFKDWLAALDPAEAKARTAAEHMAEYNTTFLPAARVNSRKAYNILIRSPGVLSQRMLTKLSGSSISADRDGHKLYELLLQPSDRKRSS